MVVSKTIDLDFDVLLSKTHITIQDPLSKRMINKVDRQGDLYVLDPSKDIIPHLPTPSHQLFVQVSQMICDIVSLDMYHILF